MHQNQKRDKVFEMLIFWVSVIACAVNQFTQFDQRVLRNVGKQVLFQSLLKSQTYIFAQVFRTDTGTEFIIGYRIAQLKESLDLFITNHKGPFMV